MGGRLREGCQSLLWAELLGPYGIYTVWGSVCGWAGIFDRSCCSGCVRSSILRVGEGHEYSSVAMQYLWCLMFVGQVHTCIQPMVWSKSESTTRFHVQKSSMPPLNAILSNASGKYNLYDRYTNILLSLINNIWLKVWWIGPNKQSTWIFNKIKKYAQFL